MISFIYKAIFIIFITATINGCASARIGDYGLSGTQTRLRPVFWEKNKARIIVGLTPSAINGHTYTLARGLITGLTGFEAVDETYSLDADLTDFVLLFDYSELQKVKLLFVDKLSQRGMQASSLDDKKLASQYHHLITSNADLASINMFREQNNADYLILFQITKCGIIKRNFKLRSILGVTAYLIDLQNGNIEWKFYSGGGEVTVLGEWKQPPDYPNVTTAIREAIILTTTK
jgi:hypothetical protein